ncbi:MAG TPA: hypothetical protein VIU82_01835 [Bosea sp. (in: a-proteobacteria)]
MTKGTPIKGRPKRPAYQTPLSIAPAKVWQYDGGALRGGKNEAPPPDRRQQAAARRAVREADRLGQRERDAAKSALGTNAKVFEIIDRLGRAGVDYSRLLALVEAAGSLAWLSRMHLGQIHALVDASSLVGWELFEQIRPLITSMERAVEDEQRRLETMAMPNPLHKPIKAKDRDYGEPEGW